MQATIVSVPYVVGLGREVEFEAPLFKTVEMDGENPVTRFLSMSLDSDVQGAYMRHMIIMTMMAQGVNMVSFV